MMDYTGNLVKTYIAVFGGTDADALRHLNRSLEHAITKGRFSQWKLTGYRMPTAPIASFMLWETLPKLLKAEGLSQEKALEITEKVTLHIKSPNQGA